MAWPTPASHILATGWDWQEDFTFVNRSEIVCHQADGKNQVREQNVSESRWIFPLKCPPSNYYHLCKSKKPKSNSRATTDCCDTQRMTPAFPRMTPPLNAREQPFSSILRIAQCFSFCFLKVRENWPLFWEFSAFHREKLFRCLIRLDWTINLLDSVITAFLMDTSCW